MVKTRRSLLVFLGLVLGSGLSCGGKSPRTPVRRADPPPPVSTSTPPAALLPSMASMASMASVGAPSDALLSSLAAAPSIRVGLSTSAPVVRLTSSRPFRVGAGAAWFESSEVLVRPERAPGAPIQGSVYRVELGSFSNESAAADFRARAASELAELSFELSVVREPSTGRYSVRLGAFPTESGGGVARRELERLGFDALGVVREETSAARATALLLVGAGAPPLRIDSLALYAVPGEPGAFLELDARPYRGYLRISVNASNALTVTNFVHLEDYLKGVVPAELSPEAFPEKEALKAQAVAARTYAVKRRGEFEAEGYDLCPTAACQVYRGVSAEHRLSTAAVQETAGEVLTYGGEPVDALYTSTCGGRTEQSENVFSKPEPYLVSRACALESRGPTAESRNPGPLTLEAAVLHRIGILGSPGEDGAASYDETRLWIEAALRHLGQSPCWRGSGEPSPRTLDLPAIADLFAQALCWERRLPFLMSPLDAERIGGLDLPDADRMRLAEALRDGLVVPDGAGIRPGRALSRREAIASVYRLLARRGEPILREGRLRRADGERLLIVEGDEAAGKRELSMGLGAVRYLYREVSGATHHVHRLALLPNDRLRYRAGDNGIDVLVLVADGGSFDRSSRFSHWLVRKSVSELSREVNLRSPVGEVRELRPKRYGASGRIAELEVVGSEASATFRGLAIRRALGIRENLFFFDPQVGPDGRVRAWVFTGRGWGHGVGLCQVGAYGMAASGFTYRDILGHYYPGTHIDKDVGRP